MSTSQTSPERHVRYRWAAEVTAGGRVLDVGCGAGWGTAVLAQAATEAVGVDFSPAAIAAAQRDHGGLARFEQGDLRDLPFDAERFDHVVCFEAIAQVADPGQALDELRRVLRPRGTLLISAPNRDVYPPGNPLHLRELNPTELEELLSTRFDKVAVHRQQAYFASLLGTAETLAEADPDATIASRVVKTTGGAPGSELHTVAAATDGEPPAAPAWVALGEEIGYRQQEEVMEEWRDRAVKAEAKAVALSRELRRLQR